MFSSSFKSPSKLLFVLSVSVLLTAPQVTFAQEICPPEGIDNIEGETPVACINAPETEVPDAQESVDADLQEDQQATQETATTAQEQTEKKQLAKPQRPFTLVDKEGVMIARKASNVREGPFNETPVVTTIARDSTVTVIGWVPGSNWYKISLSGGRAGFVHGSLLRDTAETLLERRVSTSASSALAPVEPALSAQGGVRDEEVTSSPQSSSAPLTPEPQIGAEPSNPNDVDVPILSPEQTSGSAPANTLPTLLTKAPRSLDEEREHSGQPQKSATVATAKPAQTLPDSLSVLSETVFNPPAETALVIEKNVVDRTPAAQPERDPQREKAVAAGDDLTLRSSTVANNTDETSGDGADAVADVADAASQGETDRPAGEQEPQLALPQPKNFKPRSTIIKTAAIGDSGQEEPAEAGAAAEVATNDGSFASAETNTPEDVVSVPSESVEGVQPLSDDNTDTADRTLGPVREDDAQPFEPVIDNVASVPDEPKSVVPPAQPLAKPQQVAALPSEPAQQGREADDAAAASPITDNRLQIAELAKTMYIWEETSVREGPAADDPVLTILPAPNAVRVTGKVEGEDWYQITMLDGRVGYVPGSILNQEFRVPPKEAEAAELVTTHAGPSRPIHLDQSYSTDWYISRVQIKDRDYSLDRPAEPQFKAEVSGKVLEIYENDQLRYALEVNNDQLVGAELNYSCDRMTRLPVSGTVSDDNVISIHYQQTMDGCDTVPTTGVVYELKKF